MDPSPTAAKAVMLFIALTTPVLSGCLDGSQSLGPVEPAPGWAPGDHWRYRVLDGNGTPYGNWTYRVHNETVVDPPGSEEALAVYKVEVDRSFDRDHPRWGKANESGIRVYSQESLHWTAPRCVEREPPPDGCGPWVQRFDFPLQDGKTWTYRCCGDVLSPRQLQATWIPDTNENQTAWPGAVWRISDEPGGEQDRTVTVRYYAGEVGFTVERIHYDAAGQVEDRWVLTDWSYANGTSGPRPSS